MSASKELKYNLGIILTLIIIDFTWSFVMSGTSISIAYMIVFILTFSISFFSVYFLNYYYFTPKFLDHKKYIQFGLSVVLMILVFAGIRFVLEEVISPMLFNVNNYNLDNPNIVFTYLYDSFIYALKACLYSSVIYLLFRNVEQKETLHKLSVQHEKAQLTALKSQLSPHFLFNTLNNFYVELIDDKPKTAAAVLKLSQLLRYITYETTDDFVALDKDIQFIKDYIYFYKRRYEDSLFLSFDINGDANQKKIPALILIHFVENVCKHGIINNPEKPASITLDIAENHLEVATVNHINMSEKYMEAGIGLDNINKRLSVIFKDNYILAQETYDDNIFKSYLRLPL